MKTLVEKRSDVMKKVRYLGPKSWKEWRSEILMMRRRRLWLIMALISSLYMFWSKKSNKARLWLLLSSIFTATPSWFCCFCSLLFSSLLGLGLGFPRWKGENECGLLLFSRPSLALPYPTLILAGMRCGLPFLRREGKKTAGMTCSLWARDSYCPFPHTWALHAEKKN